MQTLNHRSTGVRSLRHDRRPAAPLPTTRRRHEATSIEDQHRSYRDNPTPELRAALVEAHAGLARHVARRFTNRGEPLDDLVQVAMLALMRALDRYDPDRGVKFSTFATSTMSGELKRYFRDHAWSMRVPRSVQELHLDTNEAIETLRHQLGRSPTLPEISEYLSAPVDEVALAIEAGRAYRAQSLDAPRRLDDDSAALQIGNEDPELAAADERTLLSPLMQHLAPREQLIVQLRFGRGLTQSEIATEVGLSQMHVSRLLARSLEQLREAAVAQ